MAVCRQRRSSPATRPGTLVNPNVTFEQTVDSLAGSFYGLAVNDPGVTWFAGNVGTNSALGYLTTDAAGTTYLGSETVAPPGGNGHGPADGHRHPVAVHGQCAGHGRRHGRAGEPQRRRGFQGSRGAVCRQHDQCLDEHGRGAAGQSQRDL